MDLAGVVRDDVGSFKYKILVYIFIYLNFIVSFFISILASRVSFFLI